MPQKRSHPAIDALITKHDLRMENAYPKYEVFHQPNNWYAHAGTLKKYCGYPERRSLSFVIQHGWCSPFIYGDISAIERESTLPLIGVTSNIKIPFTENQTNKLCFELGSINSYVSSGNKREIFELSGKFPYRKLVVFPTHSTISSEVEFDVWELISKIEGYRSRFDSIVFCIYWADLLKESRWVSILAEYGEIITAGHPWDPLFQSNLRAILDEADVVASNSVGSAVGYANQLEIPIWIISMRVEHKFFSELEIFDTANNALVYRSHAAMAQYFGWFDFPIARDLNCVNILDTRNEKISSNDLLSVMELSDELVQLGYFSSPDLKERLRALSGDNQNISNKSRAMLLKLLKKSDNSRAELSEFSMKYKSMLIFDPTVGGPREVNPPASKQNDLKIDLCCGERKPEGFIGVDCYPGKMVDIVHDLNHSFPFEDSVASFVRGYDAIEHLREPLRTMNEIWRICQHDAIVELMVPSTDGRGAFQDPTHVSFWNENSFAYYTVENPAYLSHARIYGFRGAFRMLEMRSMDCGHKVIQIFVKMQAIKNNQEMD
jgi:hypothetical protein